MDAHWQNVRESAAQQAAADAIGTFFQDRTCPSNDGVTTLHGELMTCSFTILHCHFLSCLHEGIW